ncbi:MAG: ubiquinol-cytochrome c reductase subunit 9 [Lasallia pustulata]|uniref:Complex III subunit 9 n=1 Tax=Lasallia pustulata TaxID=136370 RepID=A0A5M8PUX9_9LECA|nr:MAG: ubiquinol-cytochrome c reductase subunit 9 [Lasallia pustulata]
MSGIAATVYNSIFRKNVVFLSAVFVSAFAFEIGFDTLSNKLWDARNKGRQWKDIRAKYTENEGKDDDDE